METIICILLMTMLLIFDIWSCILLSEVNKYRNYKRMDKKLREYCEQREEILKDGK